MPEGEPTGGRTLEIRVALVTSLAVASIVWPKLSLPAAFLTFISFLSLPREPLERQNEAGPSPRGGTDSSGSRSGKLIGALERGRLLRRCLFVAAAAASIGVVRFVVFEAVGGIVQGGKTATAARALSRVREIIALQDARRAYGVADHDGDGVGSAALISELVEGSRSGNAGRVPRMEVKGGQLLETRVGPALASSGYLFIVCLPSTKGPFVARAESSIDAERAEREFLVYAWPVDASVGVQSVFVGDQHEKLLVIEQDPAPYSGPGNPPGCQAALERPERWNAWRDKQPRTRLPGDPSDAKGGS